MAEARGFLGSLGGFFRRPKARPTETLGTGGTAVYSGYIQVIEKDQRLVGLQKYKTFSEVLVNTSIVAAGVRYFLNLVAKASWKVEPPEDTPEALELAERLEEILQGMTTPWHRVIRRAAMYRFYGFSIQEWTAKRLEEGAIGLLDVEPRPQVTIERWDVDESGTVQGVVQRSPQTFREIYLPRTKLVYLVDDSLSDSPEGLGLFRHLVEPARRLSRYEQLEGYGFETDLRGVPVGRIPMAQLQKMVSDGLLSEEDRRKIEQPMRDFIANHIKGPKLGVLLDSLTYQTADEKGTPSGVRQWDVDLLKAEATSQEAAAAAIERLNREIARILGVEHLLLGADSRGSQALSRDKSHNFYLTVDSTLSDLAEIMEKDLRDPLWSLNGWDEDLKPALKTEAIQFRDVEQVTGALRDMAQAGAMLDPDDPAIMEVRDLLGLSRPPETASAAEAALPGTHRGEAGPGELPEGEPEESSR